MTCECAAWGSGRERAVHGVRGEGLGPFARAAWESVAVWQSPGWATDIRGEDTDHPTTVLAVTSGGLCGFEI